MKIPLSISPFFFITAGFIGWLNSGKSPNPILYILIWVGIIFISVLVHEYGHAITSKCFGQSPKIKLVAFGGLTIPEGPKLSKWKEFLVVLNGPLFGFVLFLLALAIYSSGYFVHPTILYFLKVVIWVNFFWTIVNLIPVLPLDGGQMLRVILQSIFGVKGLRYTAILCLLFSICVAIYGFSRGYFVIGIIFSLFAFQNFDIFRKAKVISENDDNEDITRDMKEIEDLLIRDQKDEAIPKLEDLRTKAKHGVIFNLTTQYLATIKADRGEFLDVYKLLQPIKDRINIESKFFLHRAAFEVKDYSLVIELAGPSFKYVADPDIAVNSALACVMLHREKEALEWLNAAKQEGIEDIKAVLSRSEFDPIRGNAQFQRLLD